MPLLETKGAASAQGFGLTIGAAGVANYIEEVFSTYLYTGTGATLSINNGIDLSTKGGLLWTKERSAGTYGHRLTDTARGGNNWIATDSNGAQNTATNFTIFNTNGFTLDSSINHNESATTYASWTFREQAKFFDVVTYTGNNTARTISHNLGSVPGCIIVKSTSVGGAGYNWRVYHRGLTSAAYTIQLNATSPESSQPSIWNSTAPTSTVFSVGGDISVNEAGQTYVAYLFAHNAGGFGLTGSDNVISCGSYTGNGSTGQLINLGYEPQWVLIKQTDAADSWAMIDNMRGWAQVDSATLCANNVNAENATFSASGATSLDPQGFRLYNANGALNESGGTYIYVAIRRGPMKVPTDGTTVFGTRVRTGDDTSAPTITPTTAMVTDMTLTMNRSGGAGGSAGSGAVGGFVDFDRLRSYKALYTISTNAEPSPGAVGYFFDRQNGVIGNGLDTGQFFNYDTNNASYSYINYFFRRAPGFFDEVCYSGNSTNGRTVSHNLTTAPELMIVKCRTSAIGPAWVTYTASLGNTYSGDLSDTAPFSALSSFWNNTSPTSSVFSLSNNMSVNRTGDDYVAYLFATCPGVSKVGSYTGTGTTLQVNCGFTAGSRFVMIKRTDSTGAWYVWDSARGIVAGNDPYLVFNTNAAEVTGTDYVDTYSAGFEISSTAPAAINANGGTFIFLAIA